MESLLFDRHQMKISFYRDSFFLIFYSDFGVGQVEYYRPEKYFRSSPRKRIDSYGFFFPS
ncbi:hypothetical protein LEP1GSC169_0127 [Leptospira santarosai str. HAI1349]|nr:hypothetical protein LEP1GSC169_0127 [Leptospira santarosai str. HAI1349]